jgi:hypothetical protein
MAESSRASAPKAGETAISGATEASRKIFEAWASGVEATLKATFDAENAALAAGMSVLEATSGADRAAMQQWADAARQAQDAAMEAFRTNMRATRQMMNLEGTR